MESEIGTLKRCEKVVDKPEAAFEIPLGRMRSRTFDSIVGGIVYQHIDGTSDAAVLDNVLSREECNELIKITESVGYSFWDHLSETPSTDFRTAFTIETSQPDFSDELMRRLRPFIAKEMKYHDDESDRYEMDLRDGLWVPTKVNPKLLFGRYRNGGHFGPHTDGSTISSINDRTLYTLLIYLNDCEGGGETALLKSSVRDAPYKRDDKGRVISPDESVISKVEPRAGRVLIFYHNEMHEGRPLDEGYEKYIIRTDIFYTRTPPVVGADEGFGMYQKALELAEHNKPGEAAQMFRAAFKASPRLAEIYQQ
eukprot:GHVO01049176.1.p1 GENE.GHVO01049176.1~~GHVO01049176.1.p1  ORF type:complete len:319 (+),score=41.58 GHVO01049176.1:29-958(+)